MSQDKNLKDLLEELTPREIAAGQHLNYSSFFGVNRVLNFADANIPSLLFGMTPEERAFLKEISEAHLKGCDFRSRLRLEDIGRQVYSDETDLDLSRFDFYGHTNGARDAIQKVVARLGEKKPGFVFYASPNWVFDKVLAGVHPNITLGNFFADSGDSFIASLEEVTKYLKDKLLAIVIVDPANPLGYSLSQEHIERINKIQRKYGTVPIFDDVFRGLREPSERHSSSRFAENPIIVETTSKRFGARGLGVTWTLIPKDLGLGVIPELNPECEGCSSKAAVVANALYQTKYHDRVREWIINNSAAFQAGYTDAFNGRPFGTFRQAFPGMPIMTFYFQPTDRIFSPAIRNRVAPDLYLSSGIDWICNFDHKASNKENHILELAQGLSYVRICPTKEDPSRSYIGGATFATHIQDLLK